MAVNESVNQLARSSFEVDRQALDTMLVQLETASAILPMVGPTVKLVRSHYRTSQAKVSDALDIKISRFAAIEKGELPTIDEAATLLGWVREAGEQGVLGDVVRSETFEGGGGGEATNIETGVVTPAGEALPPILEDPTFGESGGDDAAMQATPDNF